MTCGLLHASYSLPEWQAVKLTFFAPCTTDLHYIGDINPFALDSLPKYEMSFEANKAKVKLQERKKFKGKE